MKRKGFTLVELLVVIAIIALLMGILMPALARVRQIAFRMVCGTNLSGIGKAMLIYANDYEDELPRAGGRGGTWGGPVDFDALTRQAAYGTDGQGNGGQATITSCFYLLVKYAEVTPKSFLCKGDSGVSEFKPADYGVGDRELIDLWDFGEGQDTVQHCSYSLHLPFDKYALTTSSDPGMAVAGDRNPWMPGPFGDKLDRLTYFSLADREHLQEGNAMQHQDEGQNVLFLDSHVQFEKSPICGINEDNIWSYWDGGDIRKGTPCQPFVLPTVTGNRRQDSLLVTDGEGPTGSTTPDKTRCFPGGTVVWVGGVQSSISSVTAGQSITSQKATTMSACDGQVEEVQKHTGTYDRYDVEFQSGGTVTVADNHYFLLASGKWASVRSLKAGSEILSLDGKVIIRKVSKTVRGFVGDVYNLKIKGSDRYAVGCDKVIVRDH